MARPEIPHLSVPLRLAGDRLATVEQDSLEEVGQCVETICRYPVGSRPELPEFGIPDFTFRPVPISPTELADAIGEWEPRATALVEETPDLFKNATEILSVEVRGGGSGD